MAAQDSDSSTAPGKQFLGRMANCLVGGQEFTTVDSEMVRNRLQLIIDGFAVELLQKPEVIKSKSQDLVGAFVHSTDVIVDNVREEDTEHVKEILENIGWLLSFAGHSEVAFFGWEYPRDSGNSQTSSCDARTRYGHHTIAIKNGETVASFIQQVYCEFARLRDERQLNVVIDYLLQAEREGQRIEVKLILAFVALESLKHTYAKANGIPYAEGRFRKQPTDPNKANKPPKKWPPYGFRELLQEMFAEVGMSPDLTKVKELRNDIIHSGTLEMPATERREHYENSHDLIREYLLRLLRYRGRFNRFATSGRTTAEL